MDLLTLKWCFFCDEWKPASTEFFYLFKKEPIEFDFRCLDCERRSDMVMSPDARRLARQSLRARRNDPDHLYKCRVRRKTYVTIVDRKIKRPSRCPSCGKKKKVQSHHLSYDMNNVLDIEWLCSSCHGEAHKKGNREEILLYR